MNLRHLDFLALSVLLLFGNAAWADGPPAHPGTKIPFSGDNIIVGDKAKLVSKKNETGAVSSQPYVFRIVPDTVIDLSIEHPKGVFAYLTERDSKSPTNDEEKQTQEIAAQFSLTIAQLGRLEFGTVIIRRAVAVEIANPVPPPKHNRSSESRFEHPDDQRL